jgi:hypothetical protein
MCLLWDGMAWDAGKKRGDRGPQVELAAHIEDDAADYVLGNRFSDLSVALVGN